MAGSLSNSWSLVKASAHVLRQDRELMVFPLLAGISSILIMASFIVPVALFGGVEALEVLDSDSGSYLGYVFGFLFYLANYFVAFFFNTALVGAALIRMEGGDPTVSDGMRIAMDRLPAILGYAAIAATVGMVIKALSERLGFIGRFIVGLLGMAWSLATFLTVPVLVTRDVGPIDAVKESAALFKQTWGEQVVGNIGMGWAGFMMGVSWTIVMGGLLFAGASIGLGPVYFLPVIGVAVLGYVALGMFLSALKGIYVAALYRYATTGDAGPIGNDVMDQAFRPKK